MKFKTGARWALIIINCCHHVTGPCFNFLLCSAHRLVSQGKLWVWIAIFGLANHRCTCSVFLGSMGGDFGFYESRCCTCKSNSLSSGRQCCLVENIQRLFFSLWRRFCSSGTIHLLHGHLGMVCLRVDHSSSHHRMRNYFRFVWSTTRGWLCIFDRVGNWQCRCSLLILTRHKHKLRQVVIRSVVVNVFDSFNGERPLLLKPLHILDRNEISLFFQ